MYLVADGYVGEITKTQHIVSKGTALEGKYLKRAMGNRF